MAVHYVTAALRKLHSRNYEIFTHIAEWLVIICWKGNSLWWVILLLIWKWLPPYRYDIIMGQSIDYTGVKKSLVLEPGTSKISIRTSIYFHPMSDGQVKKMQCQVIFLWMPSFIWQQGPTGKNLGVLVRRTSEHFKKFLPLLYMYNIVLHGKYCATWTSKFNAEKTL